MPMIIPLIMHNGRLPYVRNIPVATKLKMNLKKPNKKVANLSSIPFATSLNIK